MKASWHARHVSTFLARMAGKLADSNNFNTKGKNNIAWKGKGRSGSNRMILIYSNVSRFCKKQHTNTFYYFANRTDGWMRPVAVWMRSFL